MRRAGESAHDGCLGSQMRPVRQGRVLQADRGEGALLRALGREGPSMGLQHDPQVCRVQPGYAARRHGNGTGPCAPRALGSRCVRLHAGAGGTGDGAWFILRIMHAAHLIKRRHVTGHTSSEIGKGSRAPSTTMLCRNSMACGA